MTAKLSKFEVKHGSNQHVSKYIFSSSEAIAEAVLYEYGGFYKRTVICCSTQSGCPVGCAFCGTGKHFKCNLSAEDIVWQVMSVIDDIGVDASKIEKFQIMFMSMGEPFLNYQNVARAIHALNCIYPNAQLLVSTIAPKPKDFEEAYLEFEVLSSRIPTVGLQFSIHRSTDAERDKLIPFKSKKTLAEIAQYGRHWFNYTGRRPYCNYCVDGSNCTEGDAERLMKLFPPEIFCFTFSVVCSSDETMKDAGYRNLIEIRKFEQLFLARGYNTRIFDPAGQDDIGGGCGQLWVTQEWFKKH